MWILKLNDMRMPQIEMGHHVCRALSREAIIELLERERVTPYRDGEWSKVYRKGGPLEWCNPVDAPEYRDEYLGQGIIEIISEDEAAARARQRYRAELGDCPDVSTLMSWQVVDVTPTAGMIAESNG